jgi:archaemetzincin
MSSILLVPVAPVDRGLLKALVHPLQKTFGIPVSVYERASIDTVAVFDSGRSQYNSTTLLSSLLNQASVNGSKILGITGVDLFVPVLTFVFGEAQLDGGAAVISTFRLDETLYGLPANRTLLEERLIKEAVHELGHTFGLIHCHDYGCVMHSSTSVEEVDVKGTVLCERCTTILRDKRFERRL